MATLHSGTLPDLQQLRLRTGIVRYPISAHKYVVAIGARNVSFSGVPVVKGIHHLLDHFAANAIEHSDVVREVMRDADLSEAFVKKLVSMLVEYKILVSVDLTGLEGAPGSAGLAAFYDGVGADSLRILERLKRSSVLVLAQPAGRTLLTDFMNNAGIESSSLSLAPNVSEDTTIEAIRSIEPSTTVLCWGFPYVHPLPRTVNRLAGQMKFSVLFGVSDGERASVGPYYVPDSTPCLECLNRRSLSTSTDAEAAIFDYWAGMPLLSEVRLPSHPVFDALATSMFVLEATRILADHAPRTAGGIIEYDYDTGTSRNRSILKVPRCPDCQPKRPDRYAWDSTLSAPTVKTGDQ